MDGKTLIVEEAPDRFPSSSCGESREDDTMDGENSALEAPDRPSSVDTRRCGEDSTSKAREPSKSPGNGGSDAEETVDVTQNDWEISLFDSSRGSGARAVQSVFMYRNLFNLIPKAIGGFENLKTLKFFMNEVRAVPKEVGDLVELERLQVKVCVPDFSGFSLSKLMGLKELELAYVPPSPSSLLILTEFSSLKSLKRLSICHFSIRYLPPEIGCLVNLEELDISFNKLRNLPEEVSELSGLKLLKATHNKLVEIPPGLSLLKQLENLDLTNNRLTSLSSLKLSSMPNLQFLGIQFNLLSSSSYKIPSWICCNLEGHIEAISENDILGDTSSKDLDYDTCDVTEAQPSAISPKFTSSDMVCRIADESCVTAGSLCMKNGYNIAHDREDCVSTSSLTSENVHPDEKQSLDVLTSLSKMKRVLEDSIQSEKLESQSEVSIEVKRRKFDRPVDDYSDLSFKYSIFSFCGFDDRLPDGFYDAGRDRPFMPLQDYENCLSIDSREVILLDRENDVELDAIAFSANMLVSRVTSSAIPSSFESDIDVDDTLRRASILALFVSDCFGGSDRTSLVSRMQSSIHVSDYLETFCCTCSAGVRSSNAQSSKRLGVIGNNAFMELCEKSLRSIKRSQKSNIVPIGTIRFGICRHRAVLMKYLCDRAEPPIPCELVRGYLDNMSHAWNVILVRRSGSWVRMVVDACCPTDIREETDPEYFYRYMPFGRVNVPAAPSQSSILRCTFACPPCDKESSPSIIHCKLGKFDAALKVRELRVPESSYEEIKNFEQAFLGEVQILGAFRKHKCIVEIYGHHFSSNWVCSAGDNNRTRIFKSIIAMEYVKGGCLKSYLDKLAKKHEKHVPVSIALGIARDVARALVEVHSRQIIHRDVKSENILIDLDSKRKDGSVVVKLADFNRSVPLNSFRHTCSIWHIGSHPSNVCVGTPRWMAPEVVQAMNDRSPYGLEIDIWSYGCLLLELLTLDVPYARKTDEEFYDLLKMKKRSELTPELDALSSTSCESDRAASKDASPPRDRDSRILTLLVDLFYKCTAESAVDRPRAEQIYQQLNQIQY